jgi:7,8-dihydroneopterin aldolase/epimerase/oxygenase
MKIEIEDLTFDCIIGILPQERINTQKIIINISFEYKFQNKNFIDYSKIINEIENIMKEKKFELLEEAILFLENFLKTNYEIKNLKIKISKPDIITNCIVSLSF